MTSFKYVEPSSIARNFYRKTMYILIESAIPFLIGGAHALACYSGVVRDSKDFDIFLHRKDCARVLNILSNVGFQTELTDDKWLAKAFYAQYYVDFIFGSSNGVTLVDQDWFTYATANIVLDTPVLVVPAEEMIWQKSFVTERDRFDGADICHLILQYGDRLDFRRLLKRFDGHYRVLLCYLVYFGFVYPSERNLIPRWLMAELMNRLQAEMTADPPGEKECLGTLFSARQYTVDLTQWGFKDGRKASEQSGFSPSQDKAA